MSALVLSKKITNLIRACNPSGYPAVSVDSINEILLALRRFVARLLDLYGQEPSVIPSDDITAAFAQAVMHRRAVLVVQHPRVIPERHSPQTAGFLHAGFDNVCFVLVAGFPALF